MKQYTLPILVLIAILGITYSVYDSTAQKHETTKIDLVAAERREADSDTKLKAIQQKEIKMRQDLEGVDDFLNKWSFHFQRDHGDIDGNLSAIESRTGCFIIEKNATDIKVSLEGSDYSVVSRQFRVVGDFYELLNFLGQMEQNMELMSVWSLRMSQEMQHTSLEMVANTPKALF